MLKIFFWSYEGIKAVEENTLSFFFCIEFCGWQKNESVFCALAKKN